MSSASSDQLCSLPMFSTFNFLQARMQVVFAEIQELDLAASACTDRVCAMIILIHEQPSASCQTLPIPPEIRSCTVEMQ